MNSSKKNKSLVVIAGPTAIGKTTLAVELAKHLNTEIISADSRQFYMEMSIGTAKPAAEEMQGIPHHFVGHISVNENYNAGKFEAEAIKKLEDLFQYHDAVIMVGGSGLFIDAVCNGFDPFDDIDPEIRKQVNEEYRNKGLKWLQDEVQKKDPAYFSSADIQNPQRLMRALEVCNATGKPYSSFKTGTKKERPFEIIKILLDTDREIIYSNINKRVEEMLSKGLVDEVKALIQLKHLNALNTVGYKELISFLDGIITFERAVELIKQNTRRYAKRQLTWFRKDKDYTSFEPGDLEKIKAFLELVL